LRVGGTPTSRLSALIVSSCGSTTRKFEPKNFFGGKARLRIARNNNQTQKFYHTHFAPARHSAAILRVKSENSVPHRPENGGMACDSPLAARKEKTQAAVWQAATEVC
jgi:hypothetical protein